MNRNVLNFILLVSLGVSANSVVGVVVTKDADMVKKGAMKTVVEKKIVSDTKGDTKVVVKKKCNLKNFCAKMLDFYKVLKDNFELIGCSTLDIDKFMGGFKKYIKKNSTLFNRSKKKASFFNKVERCISIVSEIAANTEILSKKGFKHLVQFNLGLDTLYSTQDFATFVLNNEQKLLAIKNDTALGIENVATYEKKMNSCLVTMENILKESAWANEYFGCPAAKGIFSGSTSSDVGFEKLRSSITEEIIKKSAAIHGENVFFKLESEIEAMVNKIDRLRGCAKTSVYNGCDAPMLKFAKKLIVALRNHGSFINDANIAADQKNAMAAPFVRDFFRYVLDFNGLYEEHKLLKDGKVELKDASLVNTFDGKTLVICEKPEGMDDKAWESLKNTYMSKFLSTNLNTINVDSDFNFCFNKSLWIANLDKIINQDEFKYFKANKKVYNLLKDEMISRFDVMAHCIKVSLNKIKTSVISAFENLKNNCSQIGNKNPIVELKNKVCQELKNHIGKHLIGFFRQNSIPVNILDKGFNKTMETYMPFVVNINNAIERINRDKNIKINNQWVFKEEAEVFAYKGSNRVNDFVTSLMGKSFSDSLDQKTKASWFVLFKDVLKKNFASPKELKENLRQCLNGYDFVASTVDSFVSKFNMWVFTKEKYIKEVLQLLTNDVGGFYAMVKNRDRLQEVFAKAGYNAAEFFDAIKLDRDNFCKIIGDNLNKLSPMEDAVLLDQEANFAKLRLVALVDKNQTSVYDFICGTLGFDIRKLMDLKNCLASDFEHFNQEVSKVFGNKDYMKNLSENHINIYNNKYNNCIRDLTHIGKMDFLQKFSNFNSEYFVNTADNFDDNIKKINKLIVSCNDTYPKEVFNIRMSVDKHYEELIAEISAFSNKISDKNFSVDFLKSNLVVLQNKYAALNKSIADNNAKFSGLYTKILTNLGGIVKKPQGTALENVFANVNNKLIELRNSLHDFLSTQCGFNLNLRDGFSKFSDIIRVGELGNIRDISDTVFDKDFSKISKLISSYEKEIATIIAERDKKLKESREKISLDVNKQDSEINKENAEIQKQENIAKERLKSELRAYNKLQQNIQLNARLNRDEFYSALEASEEKKDVAEADSEHAVSNNAIDESINSAELETTMDEHEAIKVFDKLDEMDSKTDLKVKNTKKLNKKEKLKQEKKDDYLLDTLIKKVSKETNVSNKENNGEKNKENNGENKQGKDVVDIKKINMDATKIRAAVSNLTQLSKQSMTGKPVDSVEFLNQMKILYNSIQNLETSGGAEGALSIMNHMDNFLVNSIKNAAAALDTPIINFTHRGFLSLIKTLNCDKGLIAQILLALNLGMAQVNGGQSKDFSHILSEFVYNRVFGNNVNSIDNNVNFFSTGNKTMFLIKKQPGASYVQMVRAVLDDSADLKFSKPQNIISNKENYVLFEVSADHMGDKDKLNSLNNSAQIIV